MPKEDMNLEALLTMTSRTLRSAEPVAPLDTPAAVLAHIAEKAEKPRVEKLKRYAQYVIELCQLEAFKGHRSLALSYLPTEARSHLRKEGFSVYLDNHNSRYMVAW